jgi:hypothetical protein
VAKVVSLRADRWTPHEHGFTCPSRSRQVEKCDCGTPTAVASKIVKSSDRGMAGRARRATAAWQGAHVGRPQHGRARAARRGARVGANAKGVREGQRVRPAAPALEVTLESWSLRALGARNATRGDRIGRGRPALPRSPYPAAVAPRNRPAMLESPRVVVPPCRGLLVWSPRHATVAPCGRPAMPRLPRVVALRVRPVVLRSPRARGLQGAMVTLLLGSHKCGN